MTERDPAVVITTHRVRPGRTATFSASASSLLSAAARSPGYLGGDLVGSRSDTSTWQIICHFDSADAADAWQASPSHSLWAAVVDRYAQRVEVRCPAGPDTRIDTARPSAVTGRPSPPPRWKMAVVTLIAVFPAVLGTNLTIIPQFMGLSLVPRTFVLCVIVTVLMTWVLMPRLMKLFAPWLNRNGRVRAEPVSASTGDGPKATPDTTPNPLPPLPSTTSPPTRGAQYRAPYQRGTRRRFAGAPHKASVSPGRQVPTGRK